MLERHFDDTAILQTFYPDAKLTDTQETLAGCFVRVRKRIAVNNGQTFKRLSWIQICSRNSASLTKLV